MRQAPGYITGLQKWCKNLPVNSTIVEVGSFAGDGAKIIAPFVKHLISIDPFLPNYDPTDMASENQTLKNAEFDFYQVLQRFSNISHLKMKSIEASKLFADNSLDAIYLDGSHQYESVAEDIEAWWPKLKQQTGNVFGGHDFEKSGWSGVAKAVSEKFPNAKIEIFEDTSWQVRIGR
jgi:hypothetical protein